MEGNDEILSGNWTLLSASIMFESEKFRVDNWQRYGTRVEFQKALRSHLNRVFKEDVEQMHDFQAELWGLK